MDTLNRRMKQPSVDRSGAIARLNPPEGRELKGEALGLPSATGMIVRIPTNRHTHTHTHTYIHTQRGVDSDTHRYTDESHTHTHTHTHPDMHVNTDTHTYTGGS